jgi:hypothetical protein
MQNVWVVDLRVSGRKEVSSSTGYRKKLSKTSKQLINLNQSKVTFFPCGATAAPVNRATAMSVW